MANAATPWDAWVEGSQNSRNSRQTEEEFLAKYANGIGPDGKFKGPQSGIRFDLEGQDARRVFKNEMGGYFEEQRRGGGDDLSFVKVWVPEAKGVDAGWKQGPDNGGGFLGGLARGIGNIATGIAKNPALMAAATAGLAPMVSGGLTSAGVSAGAAKVAAPMLINGVKTLATGGTLTDAVRGAGMSYFGNQVGGAVSSAVGGDFGKFVGGVAGSVASGKSPVSAVVGGAFDLASSAFPNAGGFLPVGSEARSFISGMLPTIMGSTNSGNSLVRKPIPGSNLDRLQSQYSTEALNELIASMQRPRSTSNGDWSDTFA